MFNFKDIHETCALLFAGRQKHFLFYTHTDQLTDISTQFIDERHYSFNHFCEVSFHTILTMYFLQQNIYQPLCLFVRQLCENVKTSTTNADL